jgi:hypothetical protein
LLPMAPVGSATSIARATKFGRELAVKVQPEAMTAEPAEGSGPDSK